MFWLVPLIISIALLLAYAWQLPATFRVERSIVINAAPATIHAKLSNFRNWIQWSPWEALDPDLNRNYSGANEGVGATYAWEGKKSGSGNMLITKSDPATGISLDLNFTKPFKANNKADVSLTPSGGDTKVNWAMHGPHPFLFRVMSVFFSMDRMVGKDFEKGLANLKSQSENA